MEHRTQKREKLADMLYNTILNGELKEGDRLPGEAALSPKYKLSRPTIREALARLRTGGLIMSRQGAGIYVSKPVGQRTLEFSKPSSIAYIQRCFGYCVRLEAGAAEYVRTSFDFVIITTDITLLRSSPKRHRYASPMRAS